MITPFFYAFMMKFQSDSLVRPQLDLAPKDRLRGLAPKDRLEGLATKDRLEGLATKDRLEGLDPEEIETYLKKLKMKTVH